MAVIGLNRIFTFNLDAEPQIGDMIVMKNNINDEDTSALKDKLFVITSFTDDNSTCYGYTLNRSPQKGNDPIWGCMLDKQSDGIWRATIQEASGVVMDGTFKATYIPNPFAGGSK